MKIFKNIRVKYTHSGNRTICEIFGDNYTQEFKKLIFTEYNMPNALTRKFYNYPVFKGIAVLKEGDYYSTVIGEYIARRKALRQMYSYYSSLVSDVLCRIDTAGMKLDSFGRQLRDAKATMTNDIIDVSETNTITNP